MRKERLESFSGEELKLLAEKLGLNVDSDDKKLLIEEIIEAYEEDKIERQMANNLTMLIKQKKYQLILDDDNITLNQDDVEDLHSIQLQVSTEINLMLRDPRWAFTYWDFSRTDNHRLTPLQDKIQLILRVYQLIEDELMIQQQNKKSNYFDIPVSLEDRKWYINLPDSGAKYVVELLEMKNENDFTVICRSNEIESPLIYYDDSFRESIDDMVISSGLYDLVSDSEDESDSRRILTSNESKFLNQEFEK